MTLERELFERACEAGPRVERLVALLLANDPRTRTQGLDAVSSLAADEALAIEALPHLVAVATSKGYREGSALLARLFALLAAADDPPRAGTTALWRAFRAHLARLSRHAHRATDPEAARVAACICARFPELDVETEPLLVALSSGARAGEDRARILHALARVQASRGAPFAGAIANALARAEPDLETLAVALALAEHDPPSPLRGRLVAVLRAHLDRPPPDPRAWGRVLDRAALDRAIARLEG